jgi:DNA uptake protein ComE-like DNA-binding protein
MMKCWMRRCFAATLAMGLILGAMGCNWNKSNLSSDEEQRQRDEKTREDVPKATERLKPEIQEAGRKLGEVAEKASEEARAAAQGVQEGWSQGARNPLNLNSASERELMDLPGITQHEAARIIRGRPYRDKRDLVTRNILSDSGYAKIKDDITAK